MSPATTSAALFGTKFCFQNASMSSRVIPLTDASVPISVVAVRMALAVERPRRNLAGDGGRVVALLHQLPEPGGALPLDLFGRERRMERDVGHQVSVGREVLRQRSRRHRRRIHRAVRRERGAELRDLVGDLRARCASLFPSSSIAATKLASPGLLAGLASLPVLSTRFAGDNRHAGDAGSGSASARWRAWRTRESRAPAARAGPAFGVSKRHGLVGVDRFAAALLRLRGRGGLASRARRRSPLADRGRRAARRAQSWARCSRANALHRRRRDRAVALDVLLEIVRRAEVVVV